MTLPWLVYMRFLSIYNIIFPFILPYVHILYTLSTIYIYTTRNNIKLKLVLWYKPQFGNIFPVYIFSTLLSRLKKKEKTLYCTKSICTPFIYQLVQRFLKCNDWYVEKSKLRIEKSCHVRRSRERIRVVRKWREMEQRQMWNHLRTFENELDVSRWLPIWLAHPSKRCFKSTAEIFVFQETVKLSTLQPGNIWKDSFYLTKHEYIFIVYTMCSACATSRGCYEFPVQCYTVGGSFTGSAFSSWKTQSDF